MVGVAYRGVGTDVLWGPGLASALEWYPVLNQSDGSRLGLGADWQACFRPHPLNYGSQV